MKQYKYEAPSDKEMEYIQKALEAMNLGNIAELVVDALGRAVVMNVLSLMKTAWSTGFDAGFANAKEGEENGEKNKSKCLSISR